MQAGTVWSSPGVHGASLLQCRTCVRLNHRQVAVHSARNRRSLVVVAATGPPRSDGFSGRDFLAEFDDLLKFTPAENKDQKTSSVLSDLFKVDDKKKTDDKSLKVGMFKSRETDDKQPKEKKKKEKITKKFFGSSPGKIEVKEIVDAFKLHEGDVGSSPVQVALLTQRIKYVAAHLKEHKKDFSSQRGLRAMVEQRKRHLIYLRRTDMPMYTKVIAKLGLKDNLDKDKIAAAGRRGR